MDGRKQWLSPLDTVEQDEKGRTVKATETATGDSTERWRDQDVEVEKQRRGSPNRHRQTWRRYSAPVYHVAAPPEQTLEWSDDGVSGAHRFLRKL